MTFRRIFPLLVLCCLALPQSLAQGSMTTKKVQRALDKAGYHYEGEPGAWLLYESKYILLLFSDETENRLRIFTPVIESNEIGPQQLEQMLTANFLDAQDARYSLHEGFVVSLFTHPLRSMTREQLYDGIQQVINLSRSFGSSYSGSSAGPAPPLEKEEDEALKKRT